MASRWTAGLALAALALSAQGRAAPPPAAALLARCAAHAGNRVGLSALRTACPGIGRTLRHLQVANRLPPGWRRTITPADLEELARLTRRYAGAPPRWLPDSPLRAIALALKPPRPRPDAWSRWVSWMHHRWSLLLHRVRRWLDALARGRKHTGLERGLIYGLAALVLLTVLTVALLELRAAGRSRRPAGQVRAGTGATLPTPAVGMTDTEAQWVGLEHQPAAWLRALIEALATSHRLDAPGALTCRELALRAQFDSDAQRADFQHIATLAEWALYGPAGSAPVAEQALQRVQTLHAELRRPARTTGTGRT